MNNHKKSLLVALFSLALMVGSSVALGEPNTQSTSQNTEMAEHSIKDEVYAIQPQLGLLNFRDTGGSYRSRAAVGVGLNFNLSPLVMSEGQRDWYYGVSTGALYSHTGSANANLFGSATQSGTDNANVLIIPTDLKIGYNLSNEVRVSAHGGGNLIYRSNASSINLGVGSDSTDSLWKLYPNAGLDGEWQVGKSLSLLLRPDMTFTNGRNLFVATVGASIVGF